MNVLDVGRADPFEILFFGRVAKGLGNNLFEDVLTDVAAEFRLDQRNGRLAGTESRQPDFFLQIRDDALGFLFHLRDGHGDFQGMFTTLD